MPLRSTHQLLILSLIGPSVPSLSYKRATIGPWDKSVFPAVLEGTYGQSVTCGLVAPSPKGFAVDSGCNLTIDLSDAGTHTISIDMLVAGYSGSKRTTLSFLVTAPALMYNLQIAGFDPSLSKADQLTWLSPLSSVGGKAVLTGYTPLQGDSLVFRTTGSLAQGLALDSKTGQLSGVPESSELGSSDIYAEITRNGKTSTSSVRISTTMPGVSYTYVSASTLESSKTSKPAPFLTLGTDAIRYELHNQSVPLSSCSGTTRTLSSVSEVAIDATTGDVRPSVNVKGNYCIPVAMVVTRQGKTFKANNGAQFEIK